MAGSTHFGLYDPQSVDLLVNGFPITGYADGTFINIERNANVMDAYVGGKGEVTRVLNPDTTYTCSFTIQQNSPTNVLMQGYLTTNRFLNVPPLLSIQVKDLYGAELFSSTFGFIMTEPTRSFSNSLETREWSVFCTDGLWVPNPNAGANDRSPIQGSDTSVI